MDKLCYGKRAASIAPLGVLFSLFALITAQTGFLSISCGAKTNHTAENNIAWVSDADYIHVGEIQEVEDGTEEGYGSYLHSLRYFPKPLNRSCYQLPVAPYVPHLLRLWFYPGNSSYLNDGFAFSIETEDMLAVQNINGDPKLTPSSYEYILAPSYGLQPLYVCLVRMADYIDPFISAIELRRLEGGMYFNDSGGIYALQARYDVGGNSMVRYPHDKFDRIWTPYNLDLVYQNISTKEPISTEESSFYYPPTAVMQTAWVVNSDTAIDLPTDTTDGDTILVLYFAEIEMLNVSKPRSFSILINGENESSVTLNQRYSVKEFSVMVSSKLTSFGMRMKPNSTLLPIINAYEYYSSVDAAQTTYWRDVDALADMQGIFGIKDWISDPCYSVPWNGIGCDYTSSPPRISKIDLSGRNLRGPVPNDIAQLTGLVNLSLHNNHFTGPMPNLADITMLQRLYLQNNSLNGTLEWLSQLEFLYELNIENNNFSGVIPPVLRDCHLRFMYSGNPYLLTETRKCTPQNSRPQVLHKSKNPKKNKMKMVGIILSGIVIIGLVVGIVAKLRRKAKGYSMVMVPNPTKSRAFTRDQMIVATKNFSQEIGRGGFGPVYIGKLPEGKVIAVKVLSSVNGQGIAEFLNEVDLLSKISHKNLVSLLGYCNHIKEVMLIYEGGP